MDIKVDLVIKSFKNLLRQEIYSLSSHDYHILHVDLNTFPSYFHEYIQYFPLREKKLIQHEEHFEVIDQTQLQDTEP